MIKWICNLRTGLQYKIYDVIQDGCNCYYILFLSLMLSVVSVAMIPVDIADRWYSRRLWRRRSDSVITDDDIPF